MTAMLVVAAPRKARRHGAWTTAPESRYTVRWYDVIGRLQMRQALTGMWEPLGAWRSRGRQHEDPRRSTSRVASS